MRMSPSITDLINNAFISYDSPDHKNHNFFPNGFRNYQGRVGIDDTIFKYIVRVGKAKNGMVFYDINLEVDGKVPHAKRTSLIKSSTSKHSISQPADSVNTSEEKTDFTSDGKFDYNNDSNSHVKFSKSDSSENEFGDDNKIIKSLTKRNELLNKRLADAKRQLTITKPYSPDANQINDLANRIAVDYNEGEDIKEIAKALTNIYTLWNKGSVEKNKIDVDNANREIAVLAEMILFGDDAVIPDNESNNRAISDFANMLSTEISFIAEAEPTFADKSEALLEYQREMAKQDKKEAIAKERLKAKQKAFDKAESTKQKAEDKKYVEFWEKELDKIDKAKQRTIEKAEAELKRLNSIAARKSVMRDLKSTWAITNKQITEIAQGLVHAYNTNAKVSTIVSVIQKIYRAREMASSQPSRSEKHLNKMDEFIEQLTNMFTVRPGQSEALKGEISSLLAEISNESITKYDRVLKRGEEIKAEIDDLIDIRNAENAKDVDEKITALRKEYSDTKKTLNDDSIKEIIDNTLKWSGKSVESLIKTAKKLERQLQKDIAKMNADKIRRRRRDSSERKKLLKLMSRLKSVKTKPELMAAINEIVGDFDTIAMSITQTTVDKLNALNDEALKKKLENDTKGKQTYISPNVKAKLDRLEGKHISDMSIEEVRSLTEALLEIEHKVKSEKKMLGEEFTRTVRRAGNRIIDELKLPQTKTVKRFSKKAIKGNVTAFDSLRPETFFRMISGFVKDSVIYELYVKVKNGSRNALIYKQQANLSLKDLLNDAEYMKSIIGKDAPGIELKNGIKINKAELIALYLHSKNPDNLNHIETGGISVPDFDALRDGNMAEAYNKSAVVHLTQKEINELCRNNLNENDKKLALLVWNYFNVTSKNVLNKVSMEIYGYEKFNVENYFPIIIDKNFLSSSEVEMFDKDGNVSILEKGFAQERTPGAVAPMLLVDVLTVFDRSVSDHSLYAHLAIPLRNMKAAFGISKMVAKDGGTYEFDSVWNTLTHEWGKVAETYITDYWKNLQGETAKNLTESWADAFAGRLASSALMLNAKSAVKQFTAYPVALAELGHKPLELALKDIGRIDETRINRYNKYTPWLIQRSEGLSDATAAQLIKGKAKSRLYKATNWLQHTDVLTSKKLLKACEEWVKQQNPKLDFNSEEFIRIAAEKFNDVIEKTQQNNDVISKTRRLANQTAFIRIFTMFKSQSYQQHNMYIEAKGNLEAKEMALENETANNPVLEKELNEAWHEFNLTREGIALSTSMNALINFAFLLLRGRWDELDKDKDNEIEMWEWLLEFCNMYVNEFLSMYLHGDVVSYAKDMALNLKFGGTAFAPSDNYAMTPFIDLIDKIGYFLTESADSFMGSKNNWYDFCAKTKDLAIEGFEFAGVPANNLYNIFTTVLYNGTMLATGSEDYAQIARHLIKGDLLRKDDNKEDVTISKNVQLALFRLYNDNSNQELFDTAYSILKLAGASDKKILSAIAKGYSINLSDSDMDKMEYFTQNSSGKFKATYYFELKQIGNRINKSCEINEGDGMTNDEVTSAINKLAEKHPELTLSDKGMLWQMYTGNTSTKNNPYDGNAGQKYLDSKK